jgi:hypothetical protein
MLHRNRLERLEKQSTGQLMRLWRINHMTGPLTPVPPITERDTQEIPAVSSPHIPSMPRFVEYRSEVSGEDCFEDCLAMLYKACLLCIDTYKTLPDELYVDSHIIPSIRRRSQFIDGMAYNGKYRLFAGGDLRHIPIRTAEFLPPIIKLAVNDRLSTDQVIGLISC